MNSEFEASFSKENMEISRNVLKKITVIQFLKTLEDRSDFVLFVKQSLKQNDDLQRLNYFYSMYHKDNCQFANYSSDSNTFRSSVYLDYYYTLYLLLSRASSCIPRPRHPSQENPQPCFFVMFFSQNNSIWRYFVPLYVYKQVHVFNQRACDWPVMPKTTNHFYFP